MVRTLAAALLVALGLGGAQQLRVGVQPFSLAVAGRFLWVADYGNGDVYRLDMARRKVVQTMHVGGRPYGIAVAGGSIWVGNYSRTTVARVAPARGRVVQRVVIGGSPS